MKEPSAGSVMSRVNFMGTDGIRGKVVLDSQKNCIETFLESGALTPALVQTASFSFATLLINQGVCAGNGAVAVVGHDGRDEAFGWKLLKAVQDGFADAGIDVLDIGIVPTAVVPYLMLKKGLRCGAMLTASHNPSNQNGIKFFLDGKKLLPEGPFGDYALSEYMFRYSGKANISGKKGTVRIYDSAINDGTALMLAALPENAASLLKDVVLVLDTANGAFTEISANVLNRLGVAWTTRNEKPAGANINRGCGVGEIEGIEEFSGAAYDSHIPFIKELFDKGRTHADGRVFGISLDGDGDRGFLLAYDKVADAVHVMDGDKCGYILARYFIRKKNLAPSRYWFVSTIESDLMTSYYAAKDLGLNTRVVSVGDKWIAHFNEGELLVGLEVSGHLIFPITFTNELGKAVTLLSGIGLLSGLMTLMAVREMRLLAPEIIKPFVPGFSRTWYTFFVDKSKFYRNSGVWQSDCEIVIAKAEELKKTGSLPADLRLEFDDKEDPNVLYVSLVNGQGLLGCVFMRNSGTEDKTATYVKGRPEFRDALVTLGTFVQENHILLLKNITRVEYGYETAIMGILRDNGELGFGALKSCIEKETGSMVNESDLHGVVHGLKKEGRISVRQLNSEIKISRSAL
jgi:phosphoglucosamine mutase